MKIKEFKSQDELAKNLSELIQSLILEKLKTKETCYVILPGGTSPAQFLKKLNSLNMPWDKITFIPSDERWVDTDDNASNEKMLKSFLPQAKFLGLKTSDKTPALSQDNNQQRFARIPSPDITILGFGEDGHVASLFPGANLNSSGKFIPHEGKDFPRLSLSYKFLTQSQKIFFIAYGENKKALAATLIKQPQDLPLSFFLQNNNVEIYWAP